MFIQKFYVTFYKKVYFITLKMSKIILNKKEYPDNGIFQKIFIEEYCNLNIYPLVGILEKEAGLMSDFAEAYIAENNSLNYNIYGPDSEDILFLKDNLYNFNENTDNVFTYVHENIKKYELIKLTDIVLAIPNEFMDNKFYKKIIIHGLSKVLYFSQNVKNIFDKYFYYYLNNGILNYDNLICYTMIIKNGGELLEKVLKDNIPFMDRWCILDTGSTDGTQETIKRVLKNKK